jgi:hypothetical protein
MMRHWNEGSGIKKAVILLLGVFLAACSSNSVKLPIETSLGKLVRIEQKDNVATDERSISAEAGKVLYLLSFEGKSEIPYQGVQNEGLKSFTLVDSNGTEFSPVFTGSPTNAGPLSDKELRYNGELKGQNGKFVFVGTLSVPSGKIALVYSVPKDASGLSLKDGERRHVIN